MQTSFSPAQLADPDTAVSAGIIRSCVHCGFCTATCPTYVLLGDELDSPRGRIYLIKDMLENGRPATAQVVKHIDRCLSCLSCMTTCPSGVNYMHLVDHARHHIEKTYVRAGMHPPAPAHCIHIRRAFACFRHLIQFAHPRHRDLLKMLGNCAFFPLELEQSATGSKNAQPRARAVLFRQILQNSFGLCSCMHYES